MASFATPRVRVCQTVDSLQEVNISLKVHGSQMHVTLHLGLHMSQSALYVQVRKDATTMHHSIIVGNSPCVWPPRVPNRDCALGSPVSLSAMLECLAATVPQLVGASLNVEENTLPAQQS